MQRLQLGLPAAVQHPRDLRRVLGRGAHEVGGEELVRLFYVSGGQRQPCHLRDEVRVAAAEPRPLHIGRVAAALRCLRLGDKSGARGAA